VNNGKKLPIQEIQCRKWYCRSGRQIKAQSSTYTTRKGNEKMHLLCWEALSLQFWILRVTIHPWAHVQKDHNGIWQWLCYKRMHKQVLNIAWSVITQRAVLVREATDEKLRFDYFVDSLVCVWSQTVSALTLHSVLWRCKVRMPSVCWRKWEAALWRPTSSVVMHQWAHAKRAPLEKRP